MRFASPILLAIAFSTPILSQGDTCSPDCLWGVLADVKCGELPVFDMNCMCEKADEIHTLWRQCVDCECNGDEDPGTEAFIYHWCTGSNSTALVHQKDIMERLAMLRGGVVSTGGYALPPLPSTSADHITTTAVAVPYPTSGTSTYEEDVTTITYTLNYTTQLTPYPVGPTGPAATGTGAILTGTGSYKPRPSAPEFTDAAVAVQVPVAVAGALGLAAFLI